MTAALAIALKNWRLIAVGLLLAALGAQTMRISSAQKQAAEVQTQIAQANARAEKAERIEETRRQTAIDKEVTNAQPIFQAEARDAAAAHDSRLREPAIRYIRRACPNPPAASPGTPASDPSWCLPTCSAALSRDRKTWRESLESGAPLAPSANEPMTPSYSLGSRFPK